MIPDLAPLKNPRSLDIKQEQRKATNWMPRKKNIRFFARLKSNFLGRPREDELSKESWTSLMGSSEEVARYSLGSYLYPLPISVVFIFK